MAYRVLSHFHTFDSVILSGIGMPPTRWWRVDIPGTHFANKAMYEVLTQNNITLFLGIREIISRSNELDLVWGIGSYFMAYG